MASQFACIGTTATALALLFFPALTCAQQPAPALTDIRLPDFFSLKGETIRCTWQTLQTPDVPQMLDCVPPDQPRVSYLPEYRPQQHFLDRNEDRIRNPAIGLEFDLNTFRFLEP
jgi:hypothetical protein